MSTPVDEEEIKRLEILDDLLARATVAQIPVEANALVTYTRSWTEEQRIQSRTRMVGKATGCCLMFKM